MKGMIFAAGFGLRLRPITEIIPKPLIPVKGQPLIAHTVAFLRSNGVEEVVINLHHHAKKIMDALGNGERFGLKIIYSFEKTILGTGGGLKKAERYLSDGTFFLINSDIIADVALQDVLSFHRKKKALATMVLRKDPNIESYGAIGINRDGRIRQFLNILRPAPGEKPMKYMFTGIHILEPEVFSYIPESVFSSITEVMYPSLLLNEERVFGYIMRGYWSELGTQERYNMTLTDIEKGRVKTFFKVARSQ